MKPTNKGMTGAGKGMGGVAGGSGKSFVQNVSKCKD